MLKQKLIVVLSVIILVPSWSRANEAASKEESRNILIEMGRQTLAGVLEGDALRADLNDKKLKDTILVPRKYGRLIQVLAIKRADLKKKFGEGNYLPYRDLGNYMLKPSSQFLEFKKLMVDDFNSDGKADICVLVSSDDTKSGKTIYSAVVFLQDVNDTFTRVDPIEFEALPGQPNELVAAIKTRMKKSSNPLVGARELRVEADCKPINLNDKQSAALCDSKSEQEVNSVKFTKGRRSTVQFTISGLQESEASVISDDRIVALTYDGFECKAVDVYSWSTQKLVYSTACLGSAYCAISKFPKANECEIEITCGEAGTIKKVSICR